MNRAQRYRVNTPQVVHQTIDGEVVIINLEHGHYYSLTDAGAEVWTALAGGGSLADAVATVAAAYAGDDAAIDAAVAALVVAMEREGLIAADGIADSGTAAFLTAPAAERRDRRAFTAPVLQKFSDMQELLLLDPIHEVDETGWPAKAGPRDGND